jgi:hypothetical protein
MTFHERQREDVEVECEGYIHDIKTPATFAGCDACAEPYTTV